MNLKQLTVMSFGFLNGVPAEADSVIDVRGIRNPFYEETLKNLTGLDEPVCSYIFSDAESREYLSAVLRMLDLRMRLLEKWNSPNRHPLTIAVGCSGGRHRSVAFAVRIADHFRQLGYDVRLLHRDLEEP